MHLEYSSGFIIYRKASQGFEFLVLRKQNNEIDVPKGHIEKGENAMRAAIRETMEETGLTVQPDRFFNMRHYYWFRFNGETVKKYLTIFLSKYDGNEVKISDEHKGYEWMQASEVIRRYKSKGYDYEHFEEALKYLRNAEALEKLNSEYAKLPVKDKDWKLSRKLVKGEGPANARIMFVGQAPGANEDELGRPFIGRAGKLLDSLMKSAGIGRKKAYITSVVQFFPYGNRMPTDHEIELCMPFLLRQISIIKPELIVTLGSLASKMLCNVDSIKSNHGIVTEKDGIKYLSTLHPAAAVRISTNMPIIKEDFAKLKPLAKEAFAKRTAPKA